MLLIPWACALYCLTSRLFDERVYHSSASRHFSDLSVSSLFDCLFRDVIRTRTVYGGGVLLPLSVGLCVLVNLMSAGNMVCQWDDVAGSISQNTLGIFSFPSPCQNENTLSIFHYLMWQELHAVHDSVGSSRHIWCCSCQCRCFETSSKVLSFKTVLLTIFAHRGWNTSSLIGSHCFIVIFSLETLVAKQLENRRRRKKFKSIYCHWTHLVGDVSYANSSSQQRLVRKQGILSLNNAWVQMLIKVMSEAVWGDCGVLGPLIKDN